MEPTNHPFRKENHLPNLQGIMFHVNLQGRKEMYHWEFFFTNKDSLSLAQILRLVFLLGDLLRWAIFFIDPYVWLTWR